MNPLIPIAFGLLLPLSGNEDAESKFQVELRESVPVQLTVQTDSIVTDNFDIVFYDVIADNGGSRRIITTENRADSVIDIMDGGPWGAEGFIESFYFTDNRKETLTGYFTVSDARPMVSRAPEGGYILELTDRIVLQIINHDSAETSDYTVRDNQVTIKIGEDGRLRLESIRPKPNDADYLTRHLRIYDLSGHNADEPITATEFTRRITEIIPIPRK